MTGRKCAKKFRETASLERKKVHEKKEVAMKEDKKPKKKKKAGDVLLTVVLIAAICIFCYAAYNLIIFTQSTKRAQMSRMPLLRWH